jgi:surface polysaccharide O-acyltransferase-like enzyme
MAKGQREEELVRQDMSLFFPFFNHDALAPKRNASIDEGRFIAFIGVYAIHFACLWLDRFGEVASFFQYLCFWGRFAVPFYFLTSGFFLKVEGPLGAKMGRMAKRLLLPFLLWALFYTLPDIWADPTGMKSQLKEVDFYVNGGSGPHLWFLLSLFSCLATAVLGLHCFSKRFMWHASVALYLIGLAVTPYALLLWGQDNLFGINARNGLFLGMIFICLGALKKDFLNKAGLGLGLGLVVGGYALSGGEAWFLNLKFGQIFIGHDALLGTVLVGAGAFICFLHLPTRFCSRSLAFLGEKSLYMYLIHIYFLRKSLYWTDVNDFGHQALIFGAGVGCSIIFAVLLSEVNTWLWKGIESHRRGTQVPNLALHSTSA